MKIFFHQHRFFLGIVACFFHFSIAPVAAQSVNKKLDSLLTFTLDSMRTVLNNKSLSASIELPNEAIWAAAKGISSSSPQVKVTPNSTYLIGSVTKTLTSACILQLADEKVLRLDDSLFMWVPSFQYINPNITIRQLLRHQSGIYDVLQNPKNQPALLANQDSIWAVADLIKTFIKPPTFDPGQGWEYSNTNYFLLGMIIEKATGQAFYKELRKRFFTPLNLKSVTIPAFESAPKNVAHVWLDITGDGITDDANAFYLGWTSLNATAGAAGGYYSTASDLAKWTRRYQRGDLVSAEKMNEAHVTVGGTGLPSGTKYGLGLMERKFAGLKAYGHGGDLSYSASAWYFPTKDISITVLNNDSKFNSWALAPVVTELLKTYIKNEALVTPTNDFVPSAVPLEANLAPNPFAAQLAVSMRVPEGVSNVAFVFTNVLGSRLASIEKQSSQGEQTFLLDNLATLPSGLYLMSVLLDGKLVKTVKVSKE
jgi:D-alanyl-D-alanine carboxypeptidase